MRCGPPRLRLPTPPKAAGDRQDRLTASMASKPSMKAIAGRFDRGIGRMPQQICIVQSMESLGEIYEGAIETTNSCTVDNLNIVHKHLSECCPHNPLAAGFQQSFNDGVDLLSPLSGCLLQGFVDRPRGVGLGRIADQKIGDVAPIYLRRGFEQSLRIGASHVLYLGQLRPRNIEPERCLFLRQATREPPLLKEMAAEFAARVLDRGHRHVCSPTPPLVYSI